MWAILINGLSVCVGTLFGLIFKNFNSSKFSNFSKTSSPFISEKLTKAIVTVMGLQIFAMGIKDAISYENGMINIIYLVIGTIIGEKLNLDKRFRYLGFILQKKFAKRNHGFVKGLVTATLIYCIGSMSIIGPLKIAFEGDASIIYVKSVLDGIISILLASTYGIGVLFSAFFVVIYQGGIFIFSEFLKSATDPHVLNQMSSIGGVLLMGLAFTLVFDSKHIKITNMLPAMLLPVFVASIGKLF